ncbi:hypothetical protein [Mycobacterium sp. 852014-52144_SCH5372336]|uniref:hypothetical protein n=1 Tax=Mycobacterium sp. 852014-52144_SCH5372336 TaxID=1834115 RepID=UPI0007FC5238|nr:hypothetical protein [Mycobacterium sp. 852014-52144_SCH5372336]OBB71216.1 hypothetical protein A5759_23300 [Mycobacterium sp. 852014-52144_SCH5372336]
MSYNIQIKTSDGSVIYPSAESYSFKDGILSVQVGGDTIRYSPHHWQAFVVDPQGEDPLNLR